MKLRRLFGFVLVLASGGVVFQTATTGCTEQLASTLVTTAVSIAADVLLSALLGGVST